MDLPEFRARYPEFRTAVDELVVSILSDAEHRVSADVFGEKYDLAHGLMTAHLLAISPFGRSQRLVNDGGKTLYQTEFDALRKEVVPSLIVI